MLKYIILFSLFKVSANLHAQEALSVVWYNVENAFDTIDDPITHDEEYLPDSEKEWVSWKYWTKLNRISKVLRSSSGMQPPDVIAVCEIENADVLYQLVHRPALRAVDYRVIHYESPDFRGIDVGLAYNPATIQFFASRQIRVPIDTIDGRTTRDILLASATWNGDTLHFFVNHWPSRRGGQAVSSIKRITAARTLMSQIDSLEMKYSSPKIIVVGDFNDGPADESIELLRSSGLHIEMTDWSPNQGTHRHAGRWEYLDQWIWSQALDTGTTQVDTSYIYMNGGMIEESPRYPGIQPRRSWRGNRFTGGYSDHLPIVLRITQDGS
ncbi:MAG: endonuclease [Flavobacteriia bacterium]|nr:endonuclease [Flavobacteriia bacterium]